MKMRYKVGSIAEYLKLIEVEGLSDYVYRGQNEPYWGIKASGFRLYEGGWTTDKFYDINQMRNDYFNKVIRKLSNEEKQHFLAFCQHHGLPTNLVDFTYSPLIAMFFACQGKSTPTFTIEELIHQEAYSSLESLKNNESTKSMLIHNLINKLTKEYFSPHSEIYLIKKERLLDISDIILEYQNENFFDILKSSSDVQIEIMKKVEKIFKNNKSLIPQWISNLIDEYKRNNGDLYRLDPTELLSYDEDEECSEEGYSEMESIFEFQQKLADLDCDQYRELYFFLLNEIEDENITHGEMYRLSEYYVEYTVIESLSARIYLALLINLIQLVRESQERIDITLDIYFVYQPPNLFDRISNQKGLFIYQPYLYLIEDVYGYGVLSTQRIQPDIVIEITDYNKVLSELNFLGINTESVYSDLDNIAKSVVYEHNQRLYRTS